MELYIFREMSLDDEQLAEVNKALQGTASKSSDIIANNEIVPLPTQQIVAVTPEPAN